MWSYSGERNYTGLSNPEYFTEILRSFETDYLKIQGVKIQYP